MKRHGEIYDEGGTYIDNSSDAGCAAGSQDEVEPALSVASAKVGFET